MGLFGRSHQERLKIRNELNKKSDYSSNKVGWLPGLARSNLESFVMRELYQEYREGIGKSLWNSLGKGGEKGNIAFRVEYWTGCFRHYEDNKWSKHKELYLRDSNFY